MVIPIKIFKNKIHSGIRPCIVEVLPFVAFQGIKIPWGFRKGPAPTLLKVTQNPKDAKSEFVGIRP